MTTYNRLLAAAVIAVLIGGVSPGQVKMSVITVDGPRPLAMAADRLEELSGTPIYYEDLRYENPADVQDVTDSVARQRPLPGVRILAPRGGLLSAAVQVDALTGRLVDVRASLNALREAYLSSGYPGGFAIESAGGAYCITPAPGSVLTALVTLPLERRTGAETLQLILDQVSKAAGFRVGVGMVPLNAMLNMGLAVGAGGEPARDVLTRLFTAIGSASAVKPSPTMSYRLFFDPGHRQYALNVHGVSNRFQETAGDTGVPTPTSTGPARWLIKKPAGLK